MVLNIVNMLIENGAKFTNFIHHNIYYNIIYYIQINLDEIM
jgi:hypothetical protein